jgi:hypothetical protein
MVSNPRQSSGCPSLALVGLLGGVLAVPSARADGDVAHVRGAAALLEESVQGILPATVILPREVTGEDGKALQVTEARYCGATDKGNGKFRVAGRLAGKAGRSKQLLGGAEPCRASLAEVAARAGMDLLEGTVLVDLESSWRNWELKLVAQRAVHADRDGHAQPVAALGKPLELHGMRTADLRIDNGAGPPIVLHARPVFHAGAIEILLVLADQTPTRVPSAEATELHLTGNENLAALLPPGFANQVLRRLTWTQPLVIPTERDQIEVRDVTLIGDGAGNKAQLTTAGTAMPRSLHETVRWQVLTAGEPLHFATLQATAQPEDCASLGAMAAIACNVRNGARVAGAEGFAQAMTQRYQGRFLHDLGSPFDLHFSVAGRRIGLSGELLRTSWSGRGLLASGHLRAR